MVKLCDMVRVLVSLSPLMYREAVALSIHHHRPGLDVRIAPPEVAEEELEGFRPHLLVHNDTLPIGARALARVPCRVEIRYSDGMHARFSANGSVSEARDASTEDLLGAVDGAAAGAESGKPREDKGPRPG
jgi:hypothetical protein